MTESSWIWIFVVLLVIVIIIIVIGVIVWENVYKDPNRTRNAAGDKCSSAAPCPTGFTCSNFFCQSPGITTGSIGAACMVDGQFPTTSTSTSPGCNSSMGLMCVGGSCVQSSGSQSEGLLFSLQPGTTQSSTSSNLGTINPIPPQTSSTAPVSSLVNLRIQFGPSRPGSVRSNQLPNQKWKIDQDGNLYHFNPDRQEWENLYPAGFRWRAGNIPVRLSALAITSSQEGPMKGKTIVSFRSTDHQFSHTLFYELVTNHGRVGDHHSQIRHILTPWTLYRDDSLNGMIFCSSSDGKWMPIYGQQIKLQRNGELWLEGYLLGSNRLQVFAPSSIDPSGEYFPTKGSLN